MKFKKNLPLYLFLTAALGLRLAGLKLGLPSETGGLTTLHPDESVTFYSLERMKPGKLDFFPGDALNWGTFHLYSSGALLKSLQLAGVIKIGGREELKASLGEADKMYLAVRLLSVLYGVLSVLLLYLTGALFLPRRAALVSALLMAVAQAPVMASFLVKTDSNMIFWALAAVYFSFRLLREPSARNYLLAGFFSGLAFITKYSAALFIFFPLAAHLSSALKARAPLSGFKKVFLFACAGSAAFLLCNPYFLIRPGDEIGIILGNVSKGAVSWKGLVSYKEYFLSVLPAAMGWALVPFALAGAARWLFSGRAEKRISAVFCVLFMAWAGSTSGTYVLYTLPVLPFLFLAAGDLADSMLDRRFGKILVSAVLLQALLFTLYIKGNYLSAYTIKEADSWIRENLPADSALAIAKNDTWTPFVIRRHTGPFRISEGAPSQAPIEEGVLGLSKTYRQADYVVMSEQEYSLMRAHPAQYPRGNEALDDIFAGTREVKRFSRKLPAYMLPFNYQNMDNQVNFMNPDILVLKVYKK